LFEWATRRLWCSGEQADADCSDHRHIHEALPESVGAVTPGTEVMG
jgi:hypothetical protein